MHALISLLVRRLRKTTHPENRTTLPSRTIAVVPLALDVDHRRVANDLHKQLSGDGQRTVLLDCISADRSTGWFHAAEAGNDITLYCGEPANQQWTNLCLRQADRVLFVASTTSAFATPPWLASQIQPLRRGRLISYYFTAAAAADCNPPRTGASMCRSTLFVTFAPET